MKVAQAPSNIIYLDRFIATLMQVVIEHAGAETGTLILLENDQLAVMAQCNGSRPYNLEKSLLLTVQRSLSPSFTQQNAFKNLWCLIMQFVNRLF
jgi:hypothetical protein